MRVLLINSVCGIGSTGKICADLAEDFEKDGHEVRIAFGRDSFVPERCRKYARRIGTDLGVRLHGIRSRLLDDHGLGSAGATKAFLQWAEEYQPNLLWLHNLHGYYLNYELLFDWIKKHPDLEVRWTLHDCWAFTGHCSHFSAVNCLQWREHCKTCVQSRRYPASLFLDRCSSNFAKKKSAFTGVKNMTLITPSQWLADLVQQSFLKEYPVEVQYNRVDAAIFCPTPGDFRLRYGIVGKKMILGVANVWDDRKGLDDFLELAQRLDDSWQIVLVGLNEKQIQALPKNVLGLPRTVNAKQLAEIYSAADVFVNPSREETFGMTTVEATLCGTPAIVYKGTACEEIVDKFGGIAVEQGVDYILAELQKI